METTGKLIRVTPQELEGIFDRLEAEHANRVAIIGPHTPLSADPNNWPDPFRGQQVFQPNELWPGLVDRVIRLRHLDRLVLWMLDLGDAGARAIAEHLTQLTSLAVSSNQIGEAGACAIAEHLTHLTSLNVSSNQIGEAGASAIAEHLARLTSLHVWNNQIGDAGARAIAEHLTQLTSLHVGGNKIGGGGALTISQHLTRLTSLHVWQNSIGDAGARAIAEHLSQLTFLHVGSNNIGDAGVRAIAEHLTQLQSLDLDQNQVGQASIDVLGQRLRSLKRLSIVENKDVCDIGPLAGLTALRRLNVSKTSVSDLGPFADRIADGWPVRWERWSREDGLFVEDCPLVRPTVEIAQQGPEAVRNYFRELAAQGEDFLYEAKLLILGEGGRGRPVCCGGCISPIANSPKQTSRPAASTSIDRTLSATTAGRFG